jgi:type VI secretion system Hcp family effector
MRRTLAIVALALMFCPSQSDAGSPERTAIMKISGVPGQFTVQVAEDDWTRIRSIQPSGSPPPSGSSNPLIVRGTSTLASRGGGGSGLGTAGIQDMTITKVLDHSTPNLMDHCATGTHIAEVTLTVRTTEGENDTGYLTYELENVTVTSYNVSSSGSSEEPPNENVTVHFDEIKATYTQTEMEYRASPPASTYTPRPR